MHSSVCTGAPRAQASAVQGSGVDMVEGPPDSPATALEERATALAEREAALAEREAALAEREAATYLSEGALAWLQERIAACEVREAALLAEQLRGGGRGKEAGKDAEDGRGEEAALALEAAAGENGDARLLEARRLFLDSSDLQGAAAALIIVHAVALATVYRHQGGNIATI